VYGDDLDHIEGVAHAKDVLRQIASGLDPSVATARDVSRPPLFVPESKTLEELLGDFQEQRVHLAVVVDEYGGVSGIVTIEDLLEEIVGEIQDEFDAEEPVIRSIGKSEFLVDARLPIDELNESLDINIAADGFDTIGGLVFDQLGKVPVQGDRVHHDGLSIVVVDTVGRRPNMLRVHRTESDDSEYDSQNL
ncbi:MAG: CBS domain-containing protein, partial [Dehalococcoidia bacterium]|nr:CBS domain-containing protein [Dehalococcoidia bacterium]